MILSVRKSEPQVEERGKATYDKWVDSTVHENISQGELVASQVDLVLQVAVEVLQE